MKTHTIYLGDYDWAIRVFYDTRIKDIPTIIDALIGLECPIDSVVRSYNNIANGLANGGMTYTNVDMRESIISIGYADTLEQFLNTGIHECYHCVAHIIQHLGISPWGEEAAYLAGDIAQRMHPLLEQFMCSCKRNS